MGLFIVAIIIAVGLLSTLDIVLISNYGSNSFIYLIVFLVNISFFLIITQFYKQKEKKEISLQDKNFISETSVAIFIRLIIYLLPIVGLIGLYLVSVLNPKTELGIEDANSWVSFILGIAAFVMSLVTLWQSEGTYNKIFDALEEIRRGNEEIKRNTDIMDVLKSDNLGLRKDLGNNLSDKSNLNTDDVDQTDDIKKSMTTTPFE